MTETAKNVGFGIGLLLILVAILTTDSLGGAVLVLIGAFGGLLVGVSGASPEKDDDVGEDDP